MFELFGPVKKAIKLPSVCIDDEVFRLHYKTSFVFLFGSALLVTAKQYLGDPIDCIVEEIPQNVMDTYCWIHSTFSIPSAVFGQEGFDIAHPGVAPPLALEQGEGEDPSNNGDEGSFQYHKYYQWVALTLFFQSILFYLPHYIWKYCEDSKIKILAGGLCVPIVDEEQKTSRIDALVSYLKRNLGRHRGYALKFFLCELLNLLNIGFQIYFTDVFLDGQFSNYGAEVVSISEQDLRVRGDPLHRVFPKVTKCTFHKFGPSGTIETFDGLCILPLNIINEKIYVFLWFWFVILAIISVLHAIYRLAMIFIPSFRDHVLQCQAKKANEDDFKDFCKKFENYDWFLIHLLARNIDSSIFAEFVHKYLHPEAETKEKKCPCPCPRPRPRPCPCPRPEDNTSMCEETCRAMGCIASSGQPPTMSGGPNERPNQNKCIHAASPKPSTRSSGQPKESQNGVTPSATPSPVYPDLNNAQLDLESDFPPKPAETQALKEWLEPTTSASTPLMSSQVDPKQADPHVKPEVPKTEASSVTKEDAEEEPKKSQDQVTFASTLPSGYSGLRAEELNPKTDFHPKPAETQALKEWLEPTTSASTPLMSSQVDPKQADPHVKPEVPKTEASSVTKEDAEEDSTKTKDI